VISVFHFIAGQCTADRNMQTRDRWSRTAGYMESAVSPGLRVASESGPKAEDTCRWIMIADIEGFWFQQYRLS